MATKEVTSAPSRYEYFNSSYVHTPEGAYTENSYAYIDSMTGSSAVIYDGFSFGDLSDKAKVLGYKVSVQVSTHNFPTPTRNAVLGFRLVTGFAQGHSSNTYTSISDDNNSLYEKTSQDTTYRTCEYSNMDINSSEVTWLRNNIAKVLGGTEFGIRMLGRLVRFRNLTITIYYEENSAIYVGGGPISEVYIGSTKAKAVYLGNTKIL